MQIEYEYLRSLSFSRYQAEREQVLIEFTKLHTLALKESDYDRVILLKAGYRTTQEKLFIKYLRSEQIISWLLLDSELRQDGLTYPDIFESCMRKLRNE
jgi:hypothetical protein